jgi:hypothetical protein
MHHAEHVVVRAINRRSRADAVSAPLDGLDILRPVPRHLRSPAAIDAAMNTIYVWLTME